MYDEEPCGYCGGNGWVWGNTHDRFGYRIHDEPPRVTCEYCGGSGACAQGSLLLPCEARESIIKRGE